MSSYRFRLPQWVLFVALSTVIASGCASAPQSGGGPGPRNDDAVDYREDDYSDGYSDADLDRDVGSFNDYGRHQDDFGDPIASEEDVDEAEFLRTYMTHRRAHGELRGTVGIPLGSGFELAYGAGGKFEIEIFKDLFTGLQIHYAVQEVNSESGLGSLANREAIDFYDSLERYNVLAVFDYDFPLGVPTEDIGELTVRVGLGLGVAIIQGEENQSALQEFEVEPVYSFLARPTVETRWRAWEHGHVVAGIAYDFVAENRIEIDTAGDRREVDDDIQFDTFNLFVGFAFEW